MAQASIPELLARLRRGKPIPAIFLMGRDVYLREMARRKIADTYVPEGAREWGLSKFSAREDTVATILGQAQTLPMLARHQVVIVSEVESWDRLGEKLRDELIRRLAEYLDDPAPFTVLVFEAESLDQRMRLAKVLAERALFVSAELSGSPAERVKLAVPVVFDMAQDLGIKIEPSAAEELSELLNGELVAIRTELDKLAAYVGSGGQITGGDVELLVVSERKYTVWELTDMLAARQTERALKFLDNLLREEEQPVQLLGAMAWMYRKLLEAQDLPSGVSEWRAASHLGMRPATAALAVRQARKFPRKQLTQGIQALYEADSRLKSGGAAQRAVLEFLVARLTSSATA